MTTPRTSIDTSKIPVGVGLDPRSSLAKPTGPRRFKPDLKWSLFCLAALAVLIGLGSWQLSRYYESTAEEQFYRAQHDQAKPLTSMVGLAGTEKEVKWRRVSLKGQIDPANVELLAARYKFGQLGYGVMAPLKMSGDPKSMLIYLGWVPKHKVKDYIESLGAMKEITVEGRLDPVVGPKNNAEVKPVKTAADSDAARRVWRTPAPMGLAQYHPQLRPEAIVFSGDEATGKTIDRDRIPQDGYPPKPRLSPSKHVEYFMTWYGAAFALVCVWFALSYRREYIDPDVEQGTDEDGEDHGAVA
ncbi:MAG: SURF1 family protein [Myxococcota bacterium]